MGIEMYEESMQIAKEIECSICSMVIRSDAGDQRYCSLCGMNITNFNNILVKRKNGKLSFCCENCKSKFLKIGFRSFNMFKNPNSRQKYGML